MKYKTILEFFLGSLLLASCSGHTHTFDTAWTHDNNYHWHKATCEHADEISGKAEHTYDEDGVCTVCKFDSIDHKVTSDEWNAAFGPDTTYGISENFLIEIVAGPKDDPVHISHVVDGNKMKEDDSSYYIYDQDSLYNYYEIGTHWVKRLSEESPKDIINPYTFMIGSYDSYQYDPAVKGYICKSKTIEGGTFENIVVKFKNKKLAGWTAVMKNGTDVGYINANITYGGQIVNIPTLSKVKLMGSFDEWTQGIDMQVVEGTHTKFSIKSLHLNAGTKIKIKIDDEYINKWLSGSDTAIDSHVVVLDDESFGNVLVDANFNILFDADPESETYGVRIDVYEIISPYNIYISYKNSEGKYIYSTLDTLFSKIVLNADEKFIEYKCLGCEIYKDYKYSIIEFVGPSLTPNFVPFSLLPGGEADNFVKDGDFYTYKGDAHHVNFYIRFSPNHENASLIAEKVD